jgi:hypothetical protein
MLVNRGTIPLLLLVVAAAPSARAQTPVATTPAPPAPIEERLPVRLALQTEGAVGVGTGKFYNQLVGGRLDARFSPRLSLGGYLGYANLKGANGRAHSALTYAQVECLLGDLNNKVRVPLRFASGYLGGNGPIVRAALGFAFALGQNVDLVTELIAPTVWFTNNQTLLSMNWSLELAFKL